MNEESPRFVIAIEEDDRYLTIPIGQRLKLNKGKHVRVAPEKRKKEVEEWFLLKGWKRHAALTFAANIPRYAGHDEKYKKPTSGTKVIHSEDDQLHSSQNAQNTIFGLRQFVEPDGNTAAHFWECARSVETIKNEWQEKMWCYKNRETRVPSRLSRTSGRKKCGVIKIAKHDEEVNRLKKQNERRNRETLDCYQF